MQEMRITVIACLTLLGGAISGHSGVAFSGETPEDKSLTPVVRCEEATVNPVSGHAECVRPLGARVDPPPPRPPVVKIAVFAFELEDVSPAASLLGETTSSAAAMEKVSSAARRVLAQSGRYSLIDVSKVEAKPVTEKLLRNCNGCEAGTALQLGAEQSLIGVVTRVTQTDYYMLIQIRDARTGKILD